MQEHCYQRGPVIITYIEKLTGQNIARKQALQLGESQEVMREQHAKEDASTKGAKERDSLQRSQICPLQKLIFYISASQN